MLSGPKIYFLLAWHAQTFISSHKKIFFLASDNFKGKKLYMVHYAIIHASL